MKGAALVVCLFLAGCAAKPMQQIKTALPVECRVQTPVRPVMPTERLSPGIDLDPFVATAMAEIEIREGYEGELREALAICTAPIAQP